MDSTLIGQECVDELAARVGVGDRVAAITERAMRGDVAFAPALRERVALLQGLPETVIQDVLKDRITLSRGARTLVQTMRANGAYVAIVSGGFRQFTGAIRERLGADEDRANVLMIEGGRLTGQVMEPILGQDAKLSALKEIAAAMGLALDDTLAVGDGANDLPMLQAAGLGIAYRAKPKVAAGADARVERTDLSALLYAQGFARKDFVEGGRRVRVVAAVDSLSVEGRPSGRPSDRGRAPRARLQAVVRSLTFQQLAILRAPETERGPRPSRLCGIPISGPHLARLLLDLSPSSVLARRPCVQCAPRRARATEGGRL
jgi:phosphoserine phosphatase